MAITVAEQERIDGLDNILMRVLVQRTCKVHRPILCIVSALSGRGVLPGVLNCIERNRVDEGFFLIVVVAQIL